MPGRSWTTESVPVWFSPATASPTLSLPALLSGSHTCGWLANPLAWPRLFAVTVRPPTGPSPRITRVMNSSSFLDMAPIIMPAIRRRPSAALTTGEVWWRSCSSWTLARAVTAKARTWPSAAVPRTMWSPRRTASSLKSMTSLSRAACSLFSLAARALFSLFSSAMFFLSSHLLGTMVAKRDERQPQREARRRPAQPGFRLAAVIVQTLMWLRLHANLGSFRTKSSLRKPQNVRFLPKACLTLSGCSQALWPPSSCASRRRAGGGQPHGSREPRTPNRSASDLTRRRHNLHRHAKRLISPNALVTAQFPMNFDQ